MTTRRTLRPWTPLPIAGHWRGLSCRILDGNGNISHGDGDGDGDDDDDGGDDSRWAESLQCWNRL